MKPLRAIAPGLWSAETQLVLPGGVRLPARMLVVALAGGELLLWSPIAIDEVLATALEDLGRVRYIAAPNRFHHLFLRAAKARFPEAGLWAPKALAAKYPDLDVQGLWEEDRPPFAPEVEILALEGAPRVQEVALFHPQSRSLALTDYLFHVREAKTFGTRLLFTMVRAYGKLAQSLTWRFFIRDRRAAAQSLRRLLELDFDRLIVAHGEIVEQGGKEALRQATAWLLPREAAR